MLEDGLIRSTECKKVRSKQVSVTEDQYLEFLIYVIAMLISNELLFSIDKNLGMYFFLSRIRKHSSGKDSRHPCMYHPGMYVSLRSNDH